MDNKKRLAVMFFGGGVPLVLLGLAMFVMFQQEPITSVAQAEATQVQATQIQPKQVQPTPTNSIPLPPTISGTVVNENGVVADAIVQVQATTNKTQSSSTGTFTLSGLSGTTPVTVTAWAAGHFIGWVTVNPSAPEWEGGDNLKITLKPLPQSDNPAYEWFTFEGVSGSEACSLCHREYSEWKSDQHSRAATNAHFLDIYMGTDANGNVGQAVQFDVTGKPLPIDTTQPYHGPGFRLDNPSRGGNCASCHTPVASKASNAQNCSWSGCHTSLTIERSNGVLQYPAVPSTSLTGSAAEGVSCEFCHKIVNVVFDPKTGLPLPDMPGIMSYELVRPKTEEQQVFFGTLPDVSRPDSYLPLLSKSEYCAGCHFGVFGGVVGMGEVKGGTVIYNSYGEWKDSPYSDPVTGKTCQDCHMPVSKENWFVSPERGGLKRDNVELHDHTMLGATSTTLLQNTVTMTTDAKRNNGQIEVQVSITNDQAGHDVPTDVPIRSVILVVEAFDADGKPLALTTGPVNPEFSGNYGGVPGKTFAKVLRDDWTGETPTAAFWRPVTIVEDNRIKAMATDTTKYVFAAPSKQAVTIKVKLLYRRSFYALMQQKGWNDPDIPMEDATIELPSN